MKKMKTLVVLICTLFAINCFATTIITTFYGTKSGNSVNNPCKGETTRICAIIETEGIYDENKKTNYTIEVVKDGDGNIISKKEYAGEPESRITPIRSITPLHQRNQITPMRLVPMINDSITPANCITTITTTSE